MDRFKFRVWDKQQKKYEDIPKLINQKGELVSYTVRDDLSKFYDIEQCTGLKDKNGKLIYEGDLIKIEDDVAEIKWSNYCAGFILESSEDIFDFETTYAEECKVIGNIHENADLLEI